MKMLLLLLLCLTVAFSSVKVGEKAPTFVLLDERDRRVDFGKFIDRPTIIYFTHNACHYCTQIIAFLKRVHSRYGEKVRILTINVMARDSRLIKAYKRAFDLPFPMFAGNDPRLIRAYGINFVPVIVFIDKEGIVRRVVEHYILEEELEESVKLIMGGG
ncbi:MAG TPA: TlpA family protein disulfide reductase [Aquifex aeolicus]|uniref:TlpA family protein disulfide reductase n=1 Tax=Aquifex aeolicus TaxID=63363 RepID=A0A7C5QF62_AQUAO|nr:TlpA family protein disulfide reductase [Aquifex aeolicus]